MDYEQEVIDFLSQKENLPFVLDVAEKVEPVKEKLLLDFWNGLEAKFNAKLTEQALTDRWKVKRDHDIPSDWGGISLIPVEEPSIIYLHPGLEQWAGSLRLFYGMHWSKENKDPITFPDVRTLKLCLRNDRFKGSDWWIGYKLTDIYTRNKGFLIRISRNLDSVVDNVADISFDLIGKYVALVERANLGIRNAAQNGESYP